MRRLIPILWVAATWQLACSSREAPRDERQEEGGGGGGARGEGRTPAAEGSSGAAGSSSGPDVATPGFTRDEVILARNIRGVLDVLANDLALEDVDRSGLVLEVVRSPQRGNAVVLPDLTIRYTPGFHQVGPDDFRYRVRTLRETLGSAEVFVDVADEDWVFVDEAPFRVTPLHAPGGTSSAWRIGSLAAPIVVGGCAGDVPALWSPSAGWETLPGGHAGGCVTGGSRGAWLGVVASGEPISAFFHDEEELTPLFASGYATFEPFAIADSGALVGRARDTEENRWRGAVATPGELGEPLPIEIVEPDSHGDVVLTAAGEAATGVGARLAGYRRGSDGEDEGILLQQEGWSTWRAPGSIWTRLLGGDPAGQLAGAARWAERLPVGVLRNADGTAAQVLPGRAVLGSLRDVEPRGWVGSAFGVDGQQWAFWGSPLLVSPPLRSISPAPETRDASVAHACGHIEVGPFSHRAAGATEDDLPPPLSATHTSYSVLLPVHEEFHRGFLSLSTVAGARLSLYAFPDVMLRVRLQGGSEVVPSAYATGQCAGIARVVQYQFPETGTYVIEVLASPTDLINIVLEGGWAFE